MVSSIHIENDNNNNNTQRKWNLKRENLLKMPAVLKMNSTLANCHMLEIKFFYLNYSQLAVLTVINSLVKRECEYIGRVHFDQNGTDSECNM